LNINPLSVDMGEQSLSDSEELELELDELDEEDDLLTLFARLRFDVDLERFFCFLVCESAEGDLDLDADLCLLFLSLDTLAKMTFRVLSPTLNLFRFLFGLGVNTRLIPLFSLRPIVTARFPTRVCLCFD